MSNKPQKIFKFIADNSLVIAELFMWAFVSIGFMKLLTNGVVGLSSAMIAICIIFTLIAYLFYLALFTCKMLDTTKKPVGKDERSE